jgi:flagellar protein FliT
MTAAHPLLACYESIGHASRQMLSAARVNDWDALVDAEAECAALIARIRATGDAPLSLDAQSRKRKFEIIRAILADDAEIRTLTQPWLRRLESLLDVARTTRAADAAYRALR